MFNINLKKNEAKIWFLGQSGFYIKSSGRSIIIDPYLSDSVGKATPGFSRLYPAPISVDEAKADIFIVTHDHLDHLDPETISSYPYKEETTVVAPRHSAKKLTSLGIPIDNIIIIDHGDKKNIKGVDIEGIFALGTGADVVDTTGYRIEFENGKNIYHTSDTAFCQLLIDVAPTVDVLLPVINGKFGNLNAEQAVTLTRRVQPKYVIPQHFDMMALNSENPETFRYFCEEAGIGSKCVILQAVESLTW